MVVVEEGEGEEGGEGEMGDEVGAVRARECSRRNDVNSLHKNMVSIYIYLHLYPYPY